LPHLSAFGLEAAQVLPPESLQRGKAYSDFNEAIKRTSPSQGIGELSPIV